MTPTEATSCDRRRESLLTGSPLTGSPLTGSPLTGSPLTGSPPLESVAEQIPEHQLPGEGKRCHGYQRVEQSPPQRPDAVAPHQDRAAYHAEREQRAKQTQRQDRDGHGRDAKLEARLIAKDDKEPQREEREGRRDDPA